MFDITYCMRLPNPDIPSPEVSQSQIFDFGHQILFSIATRFGGDPGWSEVLANFQTTNEESTEELSFGGTWDEYAENLQYVINIEHIQEIDESWDENLLQKYLPIANTEPSDNLVGSTDDADDNIFYTNTSLSTPCYYGTETTYFFNIPFNDDIAHAHKSTYINFYDEDRDPIDTEVAYYWEIFKNTTTANDIKNLVQFGEKALDADSAEKMLSTITIYDLEMVMNGLGRFSLIDKNKRIFE